MRLDLFLKKSRIVPQRSVAKTLCDRGAVLLNGQTAKASQLVRAGDVLRLQAAERELEVRVLEVPLGNVAKRDVGRYVQVVQDRRPDRIAGLFENGDRD